MLISCKLLRSEIIPYAFLTFFKNIRSKNYHLNIIHKDNANDEVDDDDDYNNSDNTVWRISLPACYYFSCSYISPALL
jgi:hypothetical protein